MLKKIMDTFKNFFTETEEEQFKRVEKEKKIANQNMIIDTKICPICGGKSFDKGYIHVSGEGAVAVSGISTYHDGYNMRYDDLVHICSNCGYVLLFANFNHPKKIIK